MKTVWDVRSALTTGIVEVELLGVEGQYAKVKTDDPIYVNGWCLLGRGDWRATREEAMARAEQLRKNRLASLRKEIVNLENMAIAVRSLAQGPGITKEAAMELCIAAEKALTAEERAAFLSRFPGQRGAHVADMLDILDDQDANLHLIESMHESHGKEVPEPGLLSMACHVCANLGAISWPEISSMVARIRAVTVEPGDQK